MDEINKYLITIGSSLVAFISAQKWIIPHIVQLWDWLSTKKRDNDNRSIDVTNELYKIKKNENELIDDTFTKLIKQIERLENELQEYQSELSKLRNEILRLNSKLYKKSLIIYDLNRKCCTRQDCKLRIACENKFEDIINNNDEETK